MMRKKLKNKKIYFIAEAGINHNGSLKNALLLVKEAKVAKADYVKFQIFKPNLVSSKNAPLAKYQKKNDKSSSQLEMIKKNYLSYQDFVKIKKFCKKINIKFLASAFDLESIKFLKKLKLKEIKIPSGEINNNYFLKEISKVKRKIFLSTGMSNLKEIDHALKILTKYKIKRKDIVILQCNTAYPTPFEDVNLNCLDTFKNKYKIKVGFSDHTLGIEAAIAAVAKGAVYIEKHFTLNKKMKGPDHKSSLELEEFKSMVASCNNVSIALGTNKKKLTNSEVENIKIARRSIVAHKYIKKNTKFSFRNLTVKRPGTGIKPMNLDKLIGKKSKNNYEIDQLIKSVEL